MLALEAGILEVHLESPAANIVGFEHRARSDAQRARLESAREQLEAPLDWLVFAAEACELLDIDVNLSALEYDAGDAGHQHDDTAPDNDHADESKGHAHGHDHHHEHNEHEEDEKTSQHGQYHDDGHSELSAHYRFNCSTSNNAVDLSVSLFDVFPALQKINTQWVSETRQGAVNLSPDNNALQIR